VSKTIERHSPARKRNVWVWDSIWSDEEAEEALVRLKLTNPQLLFRFREWKPKERFRED
jgi:hypothetical protein